MNFLRTLRSVVANLQEGREAAAVRPEQNGAPSQAYLDRMRAVELTEGYIATLALAPPALKEALCRCVVQVQHPLLNVAGLLERVTSHRQSLSFALHRAGQVPTADEAQQLVRLAELQQALERLLPPTGAEEGGGR